MCERSRFTQPSGAFRAAPMTSSKSLSHEKPLLPLMLPADASIAYAGAVLLQEDERFSYQDQGENVSPLKFYSKGFIKAVSRRSIFFRELSAMQMRHFKFRIKGRRLVIRTDRPSLIGAMEGREGQSPSERSMIDETREIRL